MNYEKLLDGKKAIITAGAAGIGYAIARRFEKAGAHVFVCDINKEAVYKANSVDDNIKATVCDLRQTQLISSMVEEGLDHLKEVDIIVNNAGIAGETAAVGDQTLGGWQECLQVNMTSHFETMRLLVPRMNNDGSILSVSSVEKYPFSQKTSIKSIKLSFENLGSIFCKTRSMYPFLSSLNSLG